jgi:hypothetical protein
MSTATINWTCTADPNWEWMSDGEGNPGSPVAGNDQISGSVTLSANADYWYPCIRLVLQGVTTGNAMLRYFVQNGVGVVQAATVAQGQWANEGRSARVSTTNSTGGINLVAQVV